jgi:hypothetical protein
METTKFTLQNSDISKKILKHRQSLNTYNEEKQKIKIKMVEIICYTFMKQKIVIICIFLMKYIIY